MAIIGLGVDIIEIKRIEKALVRFGMSFTHRILTDLEVESYNRLRRKERFLAKRFAVKEAAAKALGVGVAHGVSFHDFIVSNNDSGQPILKLINKAEEIASSINVAFNHISISDEYHYAMATVIFES
ncbi:holo-[acyl-carrier-protein] synthase [Candidatus Photodesmus katoptron]|uniref:Holo-[acyl-carrier-protein] synthase n=1 Tax=Candidatus Photodesmus katoptron Akat1 TaxID=1236703 RepID=S3EGP4_9GAMM|nr:holo-ACP synthase [Candidatus Photodesmus katoptron]EPE37323.1 holo-[acyl-carrier-protein] synthase [Candidatus Photodesmus katoptron Akat1]KEY90006.1 holo-[acyl-carrier-protein] synthase [Candidatus Photodesmus katoptron]